MLKATKAYCYEEVQNYGEILFFQSITIFTQKTLILVNFLIEKGHTRTCRRVRSLETMRKYKNESAADAQCPRAEVWLK